MNRRTKMLRAAMPFFEPETADVLEAAAGVFEVRDLLMGQKEHTDLIVCGGEGREPDMEGLFRTIREFANERECRMIDMILQFFQIRRMMDLMKLMEMSGNVQGQESQSPEGMMDILKSAMPKEQQENFEMLEMVLSMMNSA